MEWLEQNWFEILKLLILFVFGGGAGILIITKIYKNQNSGTQVLGNQIINNYEIQGVGDPDKLLDASQIELEPSPKSIANSIEEARDLIGLTDEKIKLINEAFRKIYRKHKSPKNAETMIHGAVFALASRDHGNLEWKEHCSGSLRGLIDEWPQSGAMINKFLNTFDPQSDKGFPNKITHSNEYKKLEDSYNYFSDIHHHDITYILYSLQNLCGSGMKIEDNTDERFVQIVKEYLEIFILLFNSIKISA